MKRKPILATFVSVFALIMSSCGTSDSIKSLYLTSTGVSSGSTYNLAGVDSTLQLKVWAVYNSGKQVDVTNSSVWTVVPTGCVFSGNVANPCGGPLPAYGPDTVPINSTGLMTGIVPICTWLDLLNTTVTPVVPYSPPAWAYTGYYQTSATYRGFTSQPLGVGVGVTDSNAPSGGCGPS